VSDEQGRHYQECFNCNGKGYIPGKVYTPTFQMQDKCPLCKGKGYLVEDDIFAEDKETDLA